MTFGAYIVHPMVLSIAYFSQTQLQRYSPLQLGFNFAATWTLSYALAGVLFVLVEKPFMSMEIVAFKRLGPTVGSE